MVPTISTYLPNLSLQYKPAAVNQAAVALFHAPQWKSLVLHSELEAAGNIMKMM